MSQSLINEARALHQVPKEAAVQYEQLKHILLEEVNRVFDAHPEKRRLLGPNSIDLIENNHLNHVNFMSSVFHLNQFELLARVIPWVYHTYHTKGISYDYFPIELDAWSHGIKKNLTAPGTEAILGVYEWIRMRHERFISLAETHALIDMPVPDIAFAELKERFITALLGAKSAQAIAIAREAVPSHEHLEAFFMNILQPAMYDIGQKWERGEISIAQEHLASSIVGRIMSGLYTTLAKPSVSRGKALVTAAPNEYHELGPWMVSDLLELDGWEITYLGANTPSDEVVTMMHSLKPFLLALSVTMPFNLDRAETIIRAVRADEGLRSTKILVGGISFNTVPDLWRQIGADGHAVNAKDAVSLAKNWWEARASA